MIKLPDHVLWFDTPIPVHWDYDRNYWSTEYIHDVKFNEEKQTVSFRAGKMTVFGLATVKYNNFPFQSWELKPSADDGVTEFALTLTTSNVTVELLIRRQQICLASLENASTTKLQQMMGIFYEPSTLIRMLKTAGLDVFPSDDGFLYVDGVQIKHRPTEDHLYYCITMLVFRRYQFSWSRWNSQAGYKKFVLHMRSPKNNAEKQNDLLVVSDKRAYIAETGDVGQTFADGKAASGKFYPDLSTLVEDVDGEKIFDGDDVDCTFVGTIYYVLSATRFLSYS